MSDIKTVVKSSGVSQTFEKEKLFKVLNWASIGRNIDVNAFLESVVDLLS